MNRQKSSDAAVGKKPMVVPHNRVTHGAEEVKAVASVVRSGRWAVGTKVAIFEEQLQEWAQVKHAVCVGSGLGALRIGLSALDVGSNDQVLVPAYSCVALPNAVLANGAKPLIADVENGTWNIDWEKIKQPDARSPVKAVVAVNTFGVPVDVAGKATSGIPCLEDWTHGYRLADDGQSPARLDSPLAMQSFYSTKLMGVGEGGCVFTDSDDIAEYVRRCRDYSNQLPDGRKLNDKMTDISAAIGMVQLERLPQMIRRRKKLAEAYTQAFSAHPWLEEHFELPVHGDERTWYRYPICLKQASAQDVVLRLRQLGVFADLPVVDWRTGPAGSEKIADMAFLRIVSLPLYPTLRVAEQRFVVKAILEVFRSRKIK